MNSVSFRVYGTSASPQTRLRGWALPLLIGVCLLSLGCRSAVQQAIKPVYQPADLLPGVTVIRDIAYVDGADAHPEKHRLDLYLPQDPLVIQSARRNLAAPGIPVLIFAHGGSLDRGDKDLEIVGLDFYRNIGRYYSARGIAVGVVNYRLQPEVGWQEQVDDVAAATSWVYRHLLSRSPGSREDVRPRLFLAGHSAGAWLVNRVALDAEVRARHHLDGEAITGVISVSGSGFEMTDRRTWELYPREEWWAERFAVPPPGDWHEMASVVPLVSAYTQAVVGSLQGAGQEAHASAPPARSANTRKTRLQVRSVGPRFLLVYSNHEQPALARQNRLLANALQESGLEARVVAVSSESHRRTVMALSHPSKIVSREVLAFLRTARVDLAPSRQRRVVQAIEVR